VFSIQNKKENTILEIKQNFSLTGKCFSLTNFSNSKQTHESLESDFQETTFRANKRPLTVKEVLLHIKSFSSLKTIY
jgi:hypothetical protein